MKTIISDMLTGGVLPSELRPPFYNSRKRELYLPVKVAGYESEMLALFPELHMEASLKLNQENIGVQNDLAFTLIESNIKKLVWHSAASNPTTVRLNGVGRRCVVIKIPYSPDKEFFEPLQSFNPFHYLTKENLRTSASLDQATDKTIEQIDKLQTLYTMQYIELYDVKPSSIFSLLSETEGTQLSYTSERNVKSKTGHKSKVIMQSAPQYVDGNLLKQARSKPLSLKELLAVLSSNGNMYGDLSNGRSLGKTEKALELQYDNDYYSVKNGFLVGSYYDIETGQLKDNTLPMSGDNIAGQAGKTHSPIYHINMPNNMGSNFFLTKLGSKGYVVDKGKEIKAFIKNTTNTIIKAGTHCFCEKVATQIVINMDLLKMQGLTVKRLEKQGLTVSAPMLGEKLKEKGIIPGHIAERVADRSQFVMLTDTKCINTVKEVDKIIQKSKLR